MATQILDTYKEKATKLSEATEKFNDLLEKNKTPKWMQGAVSKVTSAANKLKSIADSVNNKITAAQNKLNELQSKYSLDSLLKKIGVGDNKLLTALSDKLGLKSGLFDSWASDIVNMGMSWANSMIGDVLNVGLLNMAANFADFSIMDKVMLNTVVKPLRYTGANPNYNNTLLRVCLTCDLPDTLEYLDGYNGTKYTLTNNMWNRATYAARQGCYWVPLYISKIIYKDYVNNSLGLATDSEEKAFTAKKRIVEIFKNVLVYTYSNFNEKRFKQYISKLPLILNNFSYFGTNDTELNGSYKLGDSEIDIIAPIVEMEAFGSDQNTSSISGWNDPGAGIDIDVHNFTHVDKYISLRNDYFKKIYIYMTKSSDIPTSQRLVNKALHTRLKMKSLNMLAKANNSLIKTLKNSDTFKDLVYVVDDVLGAGIHNTITALEKIKAIQSIAQQYAKKSALMGTINSVTGKDDVGSFNDYGTLAVTNSSGSDSSGSTSSSSSSTATTNTSTTAEERKQESKETIVNKVTLPSIFDNLGVTLEDFEIIDTTDMTSSELQDAINIVLSQNSNFVSTETFKLNHFSDQTGQYSTPHTFILYSTVKDKYNSLTVGNQTTIKMYALASYLVVNNAMKYKIQVMKTWYGDTNVVNIYKTLDDGSYALDSDGNKIVVTTSTENVPNSDLSNALDAFVDVCAEIYNTYKNLSSNKTFTITFDNQGIGNIEYPPLTNIKPYSVLGNVSYDLIDTDEKYTFLGWTTVPDGDTTFDFASDYVYDNITLYAKWEEATCYLKSIKLTMANNSTLKNDITGTILHQTNEILFPIKPSENSTNMSYIISIDLYDGCTSSINTGYTAVLKTDNSGTLITITNAYGKTKTYCLKYIVAPENSTRIAYKDNQGIFSTNVRNNLYITASKANPVILTRNGFTFNGWYDNEEFSGTKVVNFSYSESIDSNKFLVLYPNLTETIYTITYRDSLNNAFSGKHTEDYPVTTTYRTAKVLDTPSRDGYNFVGYHKEAAEIGKDKATTVLPKFSVTSDIKLYAEWMDPTEYAVKYGTYKIGNYDIDISKLVFYTKYVLSNGNQWAVTSTGLAEYYSDGTKYKTIRVDTLYDIPQGIAYLSEGKIWFVLTKNSTDGSKTLYYSEDSGSSWTKICKVSDIDFVFFSGVGYEDLTYLIYFLRVIYDGHILSVENNKILVDGVEWLSSANVEGWPDDNYPLIGISITIDKTLYLLFMNYGTLKISDIDINYDNEGNLIIPEKLTATLIQQWLGVDNYNIDEHSLGSAYNNSSYNTDINDDFDIEDEAAINAILSNMKEDSITINTFKNAGSISWSPETNQGNGRTIIYSDSKSEIWSWISDPDSKDLRIKWLNGYETSGLYMPSMLKPAVEVNLIRRDQQKTKFRESDVDPTKYHTVTLTSDNFTGYIGYTRKTDTEEIYLTEAYLNNEFYTKDSQGNYILNVGKEVTWEVKVDRVEVNDKGVYKGRAKEIESSDDYLEYENSYLTPSEYALMAKDTQQELADKYNEEYSGTAISTIVEINGEKYTKQTYNSGKMTDAFFEYITSDYKNDNSYQEKAAKTN